VLRNLFATTIALKLLSFAAIFVAVKTFNESQYSDYSVLIAASAFIATYANWGISTLFWKQKSFRENYAAEFLTVQALLVCMALPLAFAILYFKKINAEILPAVAMLLCSIPILINTNIATKARESNPKILPIIVLIIPLCETLSLISSYFIHKLAFLDNIFFCYSVVRLFLLLIATIYIGSLLSGRLMNALFQIVQSVEYISINSLLKVFNEGFFIVLVNIAAVAYTTFDKIFINIILGASSTASYSFSATLGLSLPALLSSTNRIYIGPERELNASCKIAANKYEKKLKKVLNTATIFVIAGVSFIYFLLPFIIKIANINFFDNTVAALFFIAGTNTFLNYFNAVTLIDNGLSKHYSLIFSTINFTCLGINIYLLSHGAMEKTSAFVYSLASLFIIFFSLLLLYQNKRNKLFRDIFICRITNMLPYLLVTSCLTLVLSL